MSIYIIIIINLLQCSLTTE